MGYRRFRLITIGRILFLAATLLGLAWLVVRGGALTLILFLAFSAFYETYGLIRYVDKTNRDLARFFDSIRYEDFSQSFKGDLAGGSFAELRKSLSRVMDTLRETRAEKEEHYQYLQTVVQHVGIGLIVFQPDGTVELMNNAIRRLLKVSGIKNVADLAAVSDELVESLLRLPPREKGLVKIERENESLYLVLAATEFRLRGQDFRLVSVQNIHRELEEKEMEAWQKLIRVITHEIMNSVTPISTLASTIGEIVRDHPSGLPGGAEEDSEVGKDIREAARTIEKRSQGLLHFVDAFRSLTLVPKPKIQVFSVQDLFARVGRLMEANISSRGIRFTSTIEPESLELAADPELIEQVLINLLLNALQALEGRAGAEIGLRAFLGARGEVVVQVSDNGPGIQPENLEKVFVPFYSTRTGGSGIGLALSLQIMRLHRGTIRVQSEPGVRTTFWLSF
jgi:two-component system, NtrC family, nitrogen regulation sensor histidine kinase NtrY